MDEPPLAKFLLAHQEQPWLAITLEVLLLLHPISAFLEVSS